MRLPNFDYATSAAYFVTIAVQGRVQCLSQIRDAKVELKPFGQVAAETWCSLGKLYPYVGIDYYVVMPDHVHAILLMLPIEGKRKPVTQLVGAFKTIATKRVNGLRGTPGAALFQRSFYERVLRNDHELSECRRYIENNPLQWELDRGILPYPWQPLAK